MRVLITGAHGQVGGSLIRMKSPEVSIVALDHGQLDISDKNAVTHAVAFARPDVVINTAAYTAVDRAESDTDSAFKVNGDGAGNLAAAAWQNGARLIHISTDFVFDGRKSRPYKPGDSTNPLGAYGASKLAGEEQIRNILGGRALILRTAWVYAAEGANFVKTMLRLMAERDKLNVVSDQIGSPTWAMSLAEAIWVAVRRPEVTGLHHWTDAGVASWYDFAVAIAEEATARGLLQRATEVIAIPTEKYPTPARRPAYSVLNCGSTEQALGTRPAHWRVNLRKMLWELSNA